MQVFEKVAVPSSHMWASIILAHARNGHPAQAITLYRRMLQSTVKADNHIFVAVLKACATAGDLESGKEVHADYLGSAVEPNIFTGNCLVEMYAKCGSLEDARRVFDNLPTKDVVTWTVMIAGYVQHEFGQKALALYADMAQDGKISANRVTYLSLVQACGIVGALHTGKQLHFQIQKSGLGADVVLGSCLVDMYGKCGRLEDACSIFQSLPKYNCFGWKLCDRNHCVRLLKACTSALQQGTQLHSEIVKRGLLEGDLVLGPCLVNMCAKCAQVEDARKLFDSLATSDAITWTVMINGYVRLGPQCLILYAKYRTERPGFSTTEQEGPCIVCKDGAGPAERPDYS